MENTNKSASCNNLIRFSAGFAATFFSQACTVEASTLRQLTLWFPDGAHCASCGARINGKRALDTFWRGKRTYCSSCDSKFSPFSKTILDGSKLSADQLEIIRICCDVGLDNKTTARYAKVLPETASHWFDKISLWEANV